MEVTKLPQLNEDVFLHIGKVSNFEPEDVNNLRQSGLGYMVRRYWRLNESVTLFNPNSNNWPTPQEWKEEIEDTDNQLKSIPVRHYKVNEFSFSRPSLNNPRSAFPISLWTQFSKYIKVLEFFQCRFNNYAMLRLVNNSVLPSVTDVRFLDCTVIKMPNYKRQLMNEFNIYQPPALLTKMTIRGKIPCPSGFWILLGNARNTLEELIFIEEGEGVVTYVRQVHPLLGRWALGWQKVFCNFEGCDQLIGVDPEHDDRHPANFRETRRVASLPGPNLVSLDLTRLSSLVMNNRNTNIFRLSGLHVSILKFSVTKFMEMNDIHRLIHQFTETLREVEVFRSPNQLLTAEFGTLDFTHNLHQLEKFTAVGTLVNGLRFLRRLQQLQSLTIRTDTFPEFKERYQFVRQLERNYLYQADWSSIFPSGTSLNRIPVIHSLSQLYIDVPMLPMREFANLVNLMPNVTDVSLRMDDQMLMGVGIWWSDLEHITALYGSRLSNAGILGFQRNSIQSLRSFVYKGLCGDSRITLGCVNGGLLLAPNLERVDMAVGRSFPLVEGRLAIKNRDNGLYPITYVTVRRCNGNDSNVDECCRRREYLKNYLSPSDWDRFYNPENPARD